MTVLRIQRHDVNAHTVTQVLQGRIGDGPIGQFDR